MSIHDQFLETATRVINTRVVTNTDVRTISDHTSWLRKYLTDKIKASAARKTFGPQRKPDNQVTPDALRKREARDRTRNGKDRASG